MHYASFVREIFVGLVTFAREVCVSTCSLVGSSVSGITQMLKELWMNFVTFLHSLGLWARNNRLDFQDDLSPDSGIFIHFVQRLLHANYQL